MVGKSSYHVKAILGMEQHGCRSIPHFSLPNKIHQFSTEIESGNRPEILLEACLSGWTSLNPRPTSKCEEITLWGAPGRVMAGRGGMTHRPTRFDGRPGAEKLWRRGPGGG